jgi:hypothetical protein
MQVRRQLAEADGAGIHLLTPKSQAAPPQDEKEKEEKETKKKKKRKKHKRKDMRKSDTLAG